MSENNDNREFNDFQDYLNSFRRGFRDGYERYKKEHEQPKPEQSNLFDDLEAQFKAEREDILRTEIREGLLGQWIIFEELHNYGFSREEAFDLLKLMLESNLK